MTPVRVFVIVFLFGKVECCCASHVGVIAEDGRGERPARTRLLEHDLLLLLLCNYCCGEKCMVLLAFIVFLGLFVGDYGEPQIREALALFILA